MLLNKKRYNLVSKVIETWQDESVISIFAILAGSFWLVGRYSEKVFNTVKDKLLEV